MLSYSKTFISTNMTIYKYFYLIPVSLLLGCATPMKETVSGYLCCNQSDWKGWVYQENTKGGAILPFGETVVVDSIKRGGYTYGTVGTNGYGFASGAGNNDAETIAWLRKIIVATDPKKQFDTWPATTRAAVSASKVMVGMTRAQVLMSLGHPPKDLTPKLESTSWKYWTVVDDDPVELTFSSAGTLEKVAGKPNAVKSVELAL
jgi:hypothetical protein